MAWNRCPASTRFAERISQCGNKEAFIIVVYHRMTQNGAPTHEIEHQVRWKQGDGKIGRYTRGESVGSVLRHL